MRSFGSDRARRGDGEQWILACRVTKGWRTRVAKTLTSPEHPGTAVYWEDQLFEVLSAEPLPNGGVEYLLQPWSETHAIRVSDRYDEESERQRVSRLRDQKVRDHKRRLVTLFGPITGHLPGVVQEHFFNDLGVLTNRLTMVSTLPGWILIGTLFFVYASAKIAEKPSPIPIWLWVVGAFFAVDSLTRFTTAWLQNRHMGSIPGAIGYVIFYYLAPNRSRLVSPFAGEKGTSVKTHLTDEQELEGKLHLRDPLFTLLSTEEQQRLAKRFGYDYKRNAPGIAWILLVFSLMGAVSSVMKLRDAATVSAFLSLITAGLLAVEQVLRLMTFPQRPVGSVLGWLVRPFVRRYVD